MKARKKIQAKNGNAKPTIPAIGWTIALIVLAVAIIYASSFILPGARAIEDFGSRYAPPPGFRAGAPEAIAEFGNYFTIRLALSIINIAIVSFLLFAYLKDYIKYRTGFALGIVAFLFSFLLYALSSLPLLHFLLGMRGIAAEFSFVPLLFSAIGLLIFLKLSNE